MTDTPNLSALRLLHAQTQMHLAQRELAALMEIQPSDLALLLSDEIMDSDPEEYELLSAISSADLFYECLLEEQGEMTVKDERTIPVTARAHEILMQAAIQHTTAANAAFYHLLTTEHGFAEGVEWGSPEVQAYITRLQDDVDAHLPRMQHKMLEKLHSTQADTDTQAQA